MGTRLAASLLLLVVSVSGGVVSGCAARPETTGQPETTRQSETHGQAETSRAGKVGGVLPQVGDATGVRPQVGDATGVRPQVGDATDVMFLQMGLAQIDEGDDLATLVERRASDPALRRLAAALNEQWREEEGTMRRWLLGWQQPLTADPAQGVHAGHGALHSLSPADLAGLRDQESGFDRTAVALLLSHLGNCVETSRMETAGGAYPPARALAATITERRQAQVRDLLAMAARQTS